LAAVCSPDQVASLLTNRGEDYSRVFGTPTTPPSAHLTEYILYRRNDPAIDVALAMHGRSRTVLRRLYDRAGAGTRAVLTSNASLFVGDQIGTGIPFRERGDAPNLIWEIVDKAPLAELRALCENPDISSGFYRSLVESWKPEGKSGVSEKRFHQIVGFLANDPRVPQSREESRERHYLDGAAEYDYNGFYVSAWKLATIVPTTPAWAEILGNLYRNLWKPYDRLDDVKGVLARWASPKTEKEVYYDPYRGLRGNIAKAFLRTTAEDMGDRDPAIRDAFLMTFDPDAREYHDIDWNGFLKLDKYPDLQLYQNMKVWASPNGRRRLRNLLWVMSKDNHDITSIGFFDERIEELKVKHPEWFVKEEKESRDDLPPVPDRVDILASEIRNLVASMEASRIHLMVMGGIFVIGLLLGHWL
jgi:hypothetical protein